ncbi:MAG: ABC transporter permease [Chloroflexi bacterium]|jgi:taurine transport system permease protein|nr:ABC transporter permease [Chloroflexota bacterium]
MIYTAKELKKQQNRKRTISLVTIAAFIGTWILMTSVMHLIPSLFFPSPNDVIATLISVKSTILEHSAITLGRVLLSFAAGSLIGIMVGLIMTRFQFIYGLLNPIIEAIRPIPPIALIPFFILWFGIGDFGKLLLSAIGCFMVMVVNTIEAVRNVPRIYKQAAASLGAEDSYAYRTVIVPGIIPELISGLRVGLALAFSLVIAAELMGAQTGIGYMIMVARRSLNTPTILLGIIIIGLEAWLMDTLLGILTRSVTKWTGRAEGH